MDWRSHITSDPAVCHGAPCIRGTRIMVWVILDELAEGSAVEAVAQSYGISREDVLAAIAFAWQ
jgi:uncharacterized protein (DUF433 family)